MKILLLFGTAGGLIFLTIPGLSAQVIDSTQQQSCVLRDTMIEAVNPNQFWLWRNARVSGGQLTLPFKIRNSPEHNTFRLTTDVTLGGYIGYTRKIATKKDYFMTVPLTAGLTFINLNNSNTDLERGTEDAEVVPGITWSTGLIFQMEQFVFGLMLGRDYASEVGTQWDHHGKLWWSFGIGFVFLQ